MSIQTQQLKTFPIPKDLDDFVESIFTKHKKCISIAGANKLPTALSSDSILPEWQQWWDSINNGGDVSVILQSGIKSIMNGAYSHATKRVYDTAIRKKLDLVQNFTTNSATADGNRLSVNEKYFHENDRNHCERTREYHHNYYHGQRPPQNCGYRNRVQNDQGNAQLDWTSNDSRLSAPSSRRYDYHEDKRLLETSFSRTTGTSLRGKIDENGSHSGKYNDIKRDVRNDGHRLHSPVVMHANGDRRHRRDHGEPRRRRRYSSGSSSRSDNPSYRHEHRSQRRSKNYETQFYTDSYDCDSIYPYDHPKHSNSSQTSSQRRAYYIDHGGVHRGSWRHSRSNRHGPIDEGSRHESRESSMVDRWKDDQSNYYHRKSHRSSDRQRAVDNVDVFPMENIRKHHRYDDKFGESRSHASSIPTVAIIKTECEQLKSINMNGKHDVSNQASPRSRKNRKSKRHRRSSNHDSNSSISGSSSSSRGSTRRHHRRHSTSSNKRRHHRRGGSDEESVSSSTHRRSRRRRKSSRHRHISGTDGTPENRKSVGDRDCIDNGKLKSLSDSRRKKNAQEQERER